MKFEKIQVFGHYDSRGGTVAVVSNYRDRAIERYMEWASFPDTETAADDYLGAAEIACVGSIADGVDLEWQMGGRVVPLRHYYDGELMGTDIDGQQLIYRQPPIGSADDPGPRWDDDAFSFILLRL